MKNTSYNTEPRKKTRRVNEVEVPDRCFVCGGGRIKADRLFDGRTMFTCIDCGCTSKN